MKHIWYALMIIGWTGFGFCMGVLYEKCNKITNQIKG